MSETNVASEWYYVRNWWKYQHYKDRNPPWIKLHRSFFTDPDVDALPDTDKIRLLKLWLLATDFDGRLPSGGRQVARTLAPGRPDVGDAVLAKFISSGLISQQDVRGSRKHPASPRALVRGREELQSNSSTETEADTRARKTRVRRGDAPTQAEATEYFTEIGSPECAVTFWNHFEACGWVARSGPILDWQAKAREWQANQSRFGGNSNGNGKSFRQQQEDAGLAQLDRLAPGWRDAPWSSGESDHPPRSLPAGKAKRR